MHVDLHWLDVAERLITFKLVSMAHNCLHHNAPRYLADYCIPISDVTWLCLVMYSLFSCISVGNLLFADQTLSRTH